MSFTLDSDFDGHVEPYRRELHAYCYRMLGSHSDADDALQEALFAAWRGRARFEGRSSLRSWLYRVATNACLRLIAERPKRLLPEEHSAPSEDTEVLPFVEGPRWLEPYPELSGASFELRESVELAFIAALQHLPAVQRAALILGEVIGFSVAEVAEFLATSVPAVNSALQRARAGVSERVPARSQQATLASLGSEAQQALVAAFVTAWGRGDVTSLVALLTEDVKFGMPPIPTWFRGRDAVARFFSERVFQTAWRLAPLRANEQLAFACYQGPHFVLGALNVVTVRDLSIAEMTGFLEPAVHRYFSLPER